MKQSEFEELLKTKPGIRTSGGEFYLSQDRINLKTLYEVFNSEIMPGERIDVLTVGSRIILSKPGGIQNIRSSSHRGIIILTNKKLMFLYVSHVSKLFGFISSDLSDQWECDSLKINTIDVVNREIADLIIETPKETYRFTIIEINDHRRIYCLIEEGIEEYKKEMLEGENAQKILKNMSENQGDTYHIGQAGAVGRYARSDGNTFAQSGDKRTLAEAAMEIQQLLRHLESTNPVATETEKIAYINDETTPSFKHRVVGALKASGETAIDEFILENKYLKVAKAAVKGWLKPDI